MPDAFGYPRSRTMAAIKSTDTAPERALRSQLHAIGIRYRLGQSVRLPNGRPVKPDMVFTGRRIAVFVDGCYWHRCPTHCRMPSSNQDYWERKFDRNVERDRDTDLRLAEAGWTVVRVWEHESPQVAARRVALIVKNSRNL